MGLLDFLQRKKRAASCEGATLGKVAPTRDSARGPDTGGSRKPEVTVKPDTEGLATRIQRTPLYVVAVVAGLAIYGGYEYLHSHPIFGNNQKPRQTRKIGPATEGYNKQPPPKKQNSQSQESKMPQNFAQNHGQSPGAGGGQPPRTPSPSAPPPNPYAAQDAAFDAALGAGASGSGGGIGLSWGEGASSPSGPGQLAAELKRDAALAQSPAVLPGAALSLGAALPAAETPAIALQAAAKKSAPPLVARETSPYELLSGSVIPAVLQTGVKSYLPGEITAVVSQNVYSSVNGATLLIPAGSRLVGAYDTQTALGVNRLAVAWTRIEFPNGTTMDLPGFTGAGGQGFAGFAGDVNDHTWLIFRNALLLSIVNAGMAVASPTSTTTNTTGVTGNQALQDSEQSLAQTFGQAEAQMLQKYINIAPTITIHPGYVFSVVVARDMVFPGPYDPAMQTGPATVEPAIAPKPNPYG
ncbi:TrbI/VirB10 family protein [Acidithiobacillus sulfuriphilus]|uniref:TrbI/VirB10 family protein n=1 Tax=Acidithiobacillus sulfuriphilus TaxID=1867749 RepID=UPI003F619CE1